MSSKACFPITCLVMILVISAVPTHAQTDPFATGDKDQRITLNLKDGDLLDVLKMISEKAGFNLVIAKEVSGTLSLNLNEVRIEDALSAVLEISGFAIEQKGNILLVRSKQQVVGPPFPKSLERRSYRLNFAPSSETAEVIKNYLSPAGSLSVHKTNNVLFIEDVSDTFPRIEPILHELDRVPEQVLIEAKILEVKLDEDLAFGIDWKKAFSKGDLTGSVQDSGFSRLPGGGSPGLFFTVATPNFQLFLDALQEKGDLNALATPKLIALNHKPAQIVIGGRLGFRVTTTIDQVTTESVEFLDVGTQLRLTPHIDAKGNIMMEIHPEVSDGSVTAGLPSKTTTEVTTSLVTRDGETIFIGGLIRERKENIKTQVPGLGSIPLLGYLFRRTEIKNTRNEIIVLITPYLGTEKIRYQADQGP